MNYYGGKELASAYRTVRKNTLQIAEDIPADQYGFRATPDVRSVGEELAHIACSMLWQMEVHGGRKTHLTFEDFGAYRAQVAAEEQRLKTREQVIEALKDNGEAFARFLEALTEEQLAERISFPPPVEPSTKSRFEMLLGVKEHEMHHRAKLMVAERLLGIVPHLTRARQQSQPAAAKS